MRETLLAAVKRRSQQREEDEHDDALIRRAAWWLLCFACAVAVISGIAYLRSEGVPEDELRGAQGDSRRCHPIQHASTGSAASQCTSAKSTV